MIRITKNGYTVEISSEALRLILVALRLTLGSAIAVWTMILATVLYVAGVA